MKQSSMDRVEFGGKIYTDPRTIHNLITNHFQEWFSNANKVEPPRDLFSTVDNKAVFMEHFNSLNLPVEMTEVFYKAVTAKMGQSPEKIKQDLSPRCSWANSVKLPNPRRKLQPGRLTH